MANLSGFDANTVEPSKVFEALPPGDYLAIIADTEMRPIKSGQGEGLNITFEVIEGAYKGQKMWSWLNLVHSSTKAVEISQRNLSAICHAVHVLKPADSVELHNIPLIVTMVKDRNDPDRTVPQGFKPVGDAPAPVARQATRPAAPAAAASATPPWKRQTVAA